MPKRLTDEEHADVWRKLWEIGLNRWNAEELAGVRAVSDHIAAIEAELKEAHAIIAELVGPEAAGDAACPVVRGRALLEGDDDAA